MKNKGVIIAGSILSVLGIAAFVVGIVFTVRDGWDDIKKLGEYKDGTVKIDDSLKSLDIEIDSATVNLHKTTEASYISYHVCSLTKVSQNKNEIDFQNSIIGVFTNHLYKDNTIDIYLNSDTNFDAEFEVNAGKFGIDNEVNFKSLDVELEAGRVEIGEINVTEDSKIVLRAGELVIDKISGNSLDVDVRAGSLKVKADVNNFKFNVSAGELTAKLSGNESDYKIDVKKSAGSCNIENTSTGDRTISGKISAGEAEITFIG